MALRPFFAAVNQAVNEGGGTFDVFGRPLVKDEGYWVGGFQKIVSPFADAPTITPEVALVARHIDNLVGHLSMSMQANDGIGLWVSEGKLYVDVSRHFTDRVKAIAAGVLNGEQAIYDVANGCDISLDEVREAIAALVTGKKEAGDGK